MLMLQQLIMVGQGGLHFTLYSLSLSAASSCCPHMHDHGCAAMAAECLQRWIRWQETLCTAADTLRLDPPPAPLLPQLYGSGGDNGQLLQFVSDMADKLEARCAARPCGRAKDAGGKAGT